MARGVVWLTRDLVAIDSVSARSDFEMSSTILAPFQVAPDATVVRAACEATAVATPRTVPCSTDAYFYQDAIEAVILGPGDIAQAHTNGEWIELS